MWVLLGWWIPVQGLRMSVLLVVGDIRGWLEANSNALGLLGMRQGPTAMLNAISAELNRAFQFQPKPVEIQPEEWVGGA